MYKKSVKRIRICVIMALCVFLACFFPCNKISVHADERDEYEDQKSRAEASKNTAEQLMEQIDEINNNIAGDALRIDNSKKDIAKIDQDIKESQQRLVEAEDDLRVEREALARVLSMIYESEESDDPLTIILKAKDTYDLINREEYVSSVSSYIDNKINSIQEKVDVLSEHNNELLKLKYKREDDLVEYEARIASFHNEITELTELVAEAEKNAEDAEALAEELKELVAQREAKERELLMPQIYDGASSGVNYTGNGTDYSYTYPYLHTEDELTLLASIIQAEAGSVSYEGMIAVGSVIMNRVDSPNFPNTIEGVVYAPYQFEPASTGALALILAQGPVQACIDAAQDVLDGKRNVPNFYFKAAWYAEAHGIEGVNIGGNVFH